MFPRCSRGPFEAAPIGSAVWNGALIGLGWWLDDAWRTVEDRMSGVSVAVAVVGVLGGAVALLVARRRGRRAQA